MRYDTTLKELFRTPPLRLLSLIAGAQPTEFLTVDYPAVKMRRPDLVFRLPNGEIRHIELQSGNDPAMDWRMLEYYPLLYHEFKTEPVQQVLYLGPRRLRMSVEIRHKNLQYRCEVIDIRDFDAEPLLDSNSPADNLLAILCRNGTEKESVRRIIKRLAKLPDKECVDRFTQLLILSGLRQAEALVYEESNLMPIRINLMENEVLRPMILDLQKREAEKSRKLGERRGQRRGKQLGQSKLLRLQMEQQFGKLPMWASKLLAEASIKQLETWGLKLRGAKRVEDVLPNPNRVSRIATKRKTSNGSNK